MVERVTTDLGNPRKTYVRVRTLIEGEIEVAGRKVEVIPGLSVILSLADAEWLRRERSVELVENEPPIVQKGIL